MARVFVLVSDPGPSDAAAALASAIRSLPPDRYQFAGLHLEGFNPCGFPSIPGKSFLNLRYWRTIRNAIRQFSPDVLHFVGNEAARFAIGLKFKLPHIFSGLQPEGLSAIGLRVLRAGSCLVHSQWESQRLGKSNPRSLKLIPLGGTAPCHSDTRLNRSSTILFAGAMDRVSQPVQAAWAFDVLRYAEPEVRLVFPNGPLRNDVQKLSFSLGFDDYRVEFAESEAEFERHRSQARVAWLTHAEGGVMSALESLAHGLRVIALRTAELSEYFGGDDRVVLAPSGDRVALAAATVKLLHQPPKAISPPSETAAAMAERFASVYDALARTAA